VRGAATHRLHSQNCGPRRDGARPDIVVLHYTAMDSVRAAADRLCDPAAEVSAHYLIAEDGALWHLVDEADRAWHAGAGAWGSVTDVNSRSIGIELANSGAHPFPEPQMARLEGLLADILARHAIAPARVIAHSDMAVGRKFDPGPRFDWARLARQGLAVRARPATPGDFAADLHRIGYRVPDGCADAALAVFRDRHRPGATGPLDDTDRALAAGLAQDHPCT
jgi:N-acetylmuramoyl-L-alanine amidase